MFKLFTFVILLIVGLNGFAQQQPLSDRSEVHPDSLDSLKKDMNLRTILLDEISINAAPNAKQDSIRLRQAFSKIFGYGGLHFKDVLTDKTYLDDYKRDRNRSAGSTASLIGVDILSLVRFFGKSGSQKKTLKKTLLEEEEGAYLARKFSTARISELTNLEGDSLQLFIAKYCPTRQELDQMSEYDLIVYIKKCYKAFADK
ncbi:hypothetical protein GCM10023231_34770 [Olivibacter ginsenosidimutans]|uniref:Uncharacterized protein n=1 Tax=Olivibacter ginsenosidimutans TaxID=1176537 RepID=A0ABP9C068_9SPHI